MIINVAREGRELLCRKKYMCMNSSMVGMFASSGALQSSSISLAGQLRSQTIRNYSGFARIEIDAGQLIQ